MLNKIRKDAIAFSTEFLKTGTQVHVGFEWNRQAWNRIC